MRIMTQLFVKLLDRMQIRFQRTRPGSILILVVVLVVLLALIGTASLSTTQGDRWVAVQNSANTQIDLIVQGAIEMAKGAIYGDLFGAFGAGVAYRPDSSISVNNSYKHLDAYDLLGQYPSTITTSQGDVWLSPRIPTAYGFGGNAPLVAWSNIGMVPGVGNFESPVVMAERYGAASLGLSAPDLALPRVYDTNATIALTQPARVSKNLGLPPRMLQPNFMFPYGTADGRSFPAFAMPPAVGGTRMVLAGDADGDGVADSGLFRFPVGEIDGVTYYGAIRIIDNNSAINVNTAWSSSTDFGFGGVPAPQVDPLGNSVGTENNLGIFPSHIGLLEMMHPPQAALAPIPPASPAITEMTAVSTYRLNGHTHNNPPQDDPSSPGGSSLPRNDFVWNTQGEALSFGLSRKLENPGFVVTGAATTDRYRRFGAGEAATLAYRNGLQNREVSRSPLERVTSDAIALDSIYRSSGNDDVNNWATNAVFGPNRQTYISDRHGIAAWWDDNFHFEGYNTAFQLSFLGNPAVSGILPHSSTPLYKRSLRSFLTTSNPVSNAVQQKFFKNSLPGAAGSTNLARRLIHPQATPPHDRSYMTYPEDPVKVNPNTGTFEELWRAFWCVMVGDNPVTGTSFAGTLADNAGSAVYDAMEFDRSGSAGQFASVGGNHTQRMFRSPIRYPDATPPVGRNMNPQEVMLLRSAIAAVQTMQMRGQAPNHSSNPLVQEQPTMFERIEFPPSADRTFFSDASTGTVRFTIFGNTPQPVITEVMVWRDTKTKDPLEGTKVNTGPYVAIELYNPYSVPITLTTKHKLATINRRSTQMYTFAPLNVTNIHTFAGETIQPGDFLVLESRAGVLWLPDQIQVRQSPPPTPVDLTSVITDGLELVLVEELDDDLPPYPVLRKPLDSYDFNGILGSGDLMTWWHYSRPCGVNAKWQSIYPGRYQVHGDANRSRHQGTDWKEWAPDDNTGGARNTDPGIEAPYQPSLGYAAGRDPNNLANDSYTPTVRAALPIPLNDLDFGGPNKKIDVNGNRFPYGGFMRDGDLLQVPYVGAYVITLHTNDTDPGILVDMNSVTMDAAFAEDSDPMNDSSWNDTAPREHVGRFAPLRLGPTDSSLYNDDFDPSEEASVVMKRRYAWAKDLFDYFSVNTPSLDFLPQYPMQREYLNLNSQSKRFFKGSLYSVYDPAFRQHKIYRCEITGDYAVTSLSPETEHGAAFTLITSTASVKNGTQQASSFGVGPGAETESHIGVQGLININTASWKVLSAVPWVTRGGPDRFTTDDYSGAFTVGQNDRDDNEDIARAIVYWRDGNATNTSSAPAGGPFRSLFDLYRVRLPVVTTDPGNYVFDLVQNTLAGTTEPDDSLGDFSPAFGNLMATDPKDGSRYDFEERFWLLTKVSNLLTTRSDSFTVYVQVQGWRGIGTLRPELVVQRRAAFMLDRSTVTKTSSRIPAAMNVPND